jgi:hypothetical protein
MLHSSKLIPIRSLGMFFHSTEDFKFYP